MAALSTRGAQQASQIADQGTRIAHLATPVGSLSVAAIQRMDAMTTRPGLTGSVVIEDGRCCVGGTAGQAILVEVQFQAESPVAEATEMRMRLAGMRLSEADMAEAELQAFLPRQSFPVDVAVNWVGLYVNAQFRDALGNISPVHTDDLSVEGHPPPPSTPSPGS